ncbi:MAG TPA: beta-galactosidase, partial [Balneolales bacterium]|nr:beta-galactosidase [Balneolales bacterium]
MKKYLFLIICLAFSYTQSTWAQQTISIDASKVKEPKISYPFNMGNPGPAGKQIKINNLYMTMGGKPMLPVMGEMHFSRVPRKKWQDILLKMKAAGIQVISTYVFWIHHEEIEGQFNWSGNENFRAFLKLCKKDGLYVFARIGPWSHGEVRNGGFPDWLLKKKYIRPRSNDPVFQQYVREYFKQISMQMKGLLYKDGGPVIGIQLENEYSGGKGGEKYIEWLKKTAIQDGMNAPYYAVTGWGNASIPKDQVIPLWGGYPGAPWNPNLKKITNSSSFVFEDSRSSGNIYQGARRKGYHPDTKIYPYFTVELGLGNEITYHRRPVFSPIDGLTIALSKLGSGANMIGYYMFAGGSNPVGELSTMEENRSQTGYWNSYPIISYDFQTAIKETGELAPSYYQIKKLHYFINEFGSQLAPMMPVIGPQKNPHKNLL